jgi:hypothetical protein
VRTTVDIEEALLMDLKERARQTGQPLRVIFNLVLRRGMADEAKRAGAREPYRCLTFAMGEPVSAAFDLDKALHLAEVLEDQAIVHKLELRK